MDITAGDTESRNSNEIPRNDELEELICRLREAKATYRAKQRSRLLNRIRFINDADHAYNLNTEKLIELAKRLKHKNQVTSEMLKTIMNSVLDSEKNVEAFLSVDGALQSILRAFSGQNEKFQVLTARCICNLALGNSKVTFPVLKASDSYLFAHLLGKNNYVKEACAVALGNFSRHGELHIRYLLAKGFFSNIFHSLTCADEFLEDSLIYALTQVVYHGFNILSYEDLQSTLESITPIFNAKSFKVVFLMSLISAQKSSHSYIYYHKLHITTLKYLNISLKHKDKDSVFYLRIISNCIDKDNISMAKDLVITHSYLLSECVNLMLQSDKLYLKKECLGMIGNILNCPEVSFKDFSINHINKHLSCVQDYINMFN